MDIQRNDKNANQALFPRQPLGNQSTATNQASQNLSQAFNTPQHQNSSWGDSGFLKSLVNLLQQLLGALSTGHQGGP